MCIRDRGRREGRERGEGGGTESASRVRVGDGVAREGGSEGGSEGGGRRNGGSRRVTLHGEIKGNSARSWCRQYGGCGGTPLIPRSASRRAGALLWK
eukprot:3538001-Rhodomonas_salina.1